MSIMSSQEGCMRRIMYPTLGLLLLSFAVASAQYIPRPPGPPEPPPNWPIPGQRPNPNLGQGYPQGVSNSRSAAWCSQLRPIVHP
jgi:hypothetical protein